VPGVLGGVEDRDCGADDDADGGSSPDILPELWEKRGKLKTTNANGKDDGSQSMDSLWSP
jgi:hypothetical protein